jgi:RNA polymerase sigma-70 factor, ECF subfamily
VADEDSFRSLYDRHFAFVWRTLRRYGVRGAELEDAVQEVFTIVHRKLSMFEGRSSMRTWVFGIARRVARNHRPASGEHVMEFEAVDLVADSEQKGPAASAERLEEARLLHRLLAELRPERREIFVLVELEQLTLLEAAEILGENSNTLSSRLRAARKDLEHALERLRAHSDWRRQCKTATES